ncbi:FtsW/RodA/SpoVE family cell cycle protein [Pseudoduganella umbonata]|nr:FtsW/RodA/SpoVE family cell cycle protein [Pseudoduganella umbonata]MBB3219437.1 cell division protein FtsW [Pseudoduganella umbonata]
MLFALQVFALLRAPAAWLPAAITIGIDRPGAVTLSAGQLGAVGATGTRLVFSRSADGGWWLRTSGPARPLLRRDGIDERLGTVDASTLRTFTIGGRTFDVRPDTTGMLAFADGASRWRFDGATVFRDGTPQPPCPGASWPAQAVALWNRATPAVVAIARPLVFGGNLHCGNRIGIDGVDGGAAQVARHGGQLLLSAGAAASGTHLSARFSSHSSMEIPAPASLQDDARRLDGVQALTLGRTRYDLALVRGVLTLAPAGRVALNAFPETVLPPGVAWQWRQRSLWLGDAAAWLLAGAAALAVFAAARLGRAMAPRRGNILGPLADARRRRAASSWTGRPLRGAAAALVLAAGCTALLLQRGGEPPAAACSLLLAASALGIWLVHPARLAAGAGAALLLIAAGLLCQLNLGLAGPDTGWLRYHGKTAALLAIGSGAIALWRAFPPAVSQRRIEWLLAGAAGGALLLLAAQVLWGDETGVFDMQPVEAAKLVLTLLTAHCLALRMGWHADHRERPGHGARWLRLVAPALLFLALLGCALVQVDDYSPLILLLLWAGAMALAWALAARRWLAAGLLGCVALAGIAGVTALRSGDPAQLPASFYGDRFQVWLEPARHPHTGQQVLQGAAAIASGGWLGADGMLGLASLGHAGGDVMALPAVQDDFAPAFLLHRHGLLAALLLWCAQALLVAGLVRAAVSHGRAGAGAPGFRQAWLLRLQAFALCGGAAFVAGHLLLSWGTNLAILPVMGQPMSFLSAGGSHLLFFLLPLLGVHAGSSQE